MLGVFGMKFGNAREVALRLFQHVRALVPLGQHVEHHAVAAARKEHGARAVCDVEPRVVQRALRIAHAFIRLGEVAIEILRAFRPLQFLQQKPQIALCLAPYTARCIARMEQYELLLCSEGKAQLAVPALDMLVDTPRVADLGRAAEGAHDVGMIDALLLLAVDVKIYDLHGERVVPFRFFQNGRKIPARRFGKPLVRIEEDDPVACRMRKRLVSRRREIVAPRAVKELHLGKSLRNAARIILGAGIADDDLIDARRYALDGCGDIRALVLRDIAS